MKQLYVLAALCFSTSALFSQTLFTYGSHSVSKDEFLKAYNKNKTPVTDKEASLKEYLDLYSKFKLKVTAAKDQRLDTLAQLEYDLQNFRSQVEESYMNDEKGLGLLVDEALARSQRDIHVLHFSIPINSKMPAADTVRIYQLMKSLTEGLKNSSADAGTTAAKYQPVKGDDLGYITVFSLPYEMENLVYALKPGEVSVPYRTRSTLHLFKNVEERPSAGKWKVAQILLSIPPGAAATELQSLQKKADSIYNLLVKGADFTALAKQFSEDKLTYLNGGEMAEFGTGKFEGAFEEKVFALKKDGELTKPFLTSYGYHIVKRLGQHPIAADKTDEANVAVIKQEVSQDTRVNAAKAEFLKTIKVKTGYKRNVLVKDAELYRYADSVAAKGFVQFYPINKKVIFSFTKQNVTGEDWLNFIKDFKLNRDVYKDESNPELLDKYITTATNEYYRRHLEEFNGEFKYQLQEFKEGNMLFEVMERNVWTKASGDSAGLIKYYNEHKAKYKWSESASVLLFTCSDSAAAVDAINALKAGKDWKEMSEASNGKLQSDSGRYEVAQIQLPEGTHLTEGLITTPVVNNGDNTAAFVKVLKLFPADQQRSFEEARGLVINDYQGFLEEKWIIQLKNTYPVKINEAVFQSLLR